MEKPFNELARSIATSFSKGAAARKLSSLMSTIEAPYSNGDMLLKE